MLAYLSGSIEYASDHGKGWREAVTPFLRSLGHQVYDPAADVRKNLSDEEAGNFRGWKRTDLPRFRATLQKIIAWDLDWIERKCDYVVAFWDEAAQRGAGTGGELTVAHRRGVPVYLVVEMPVEQVSGWVLGCATRVFSGFEEWQAFMRAEFARSAGEGATATTGGRGKR